MNWSRLPRALALLSLVLTSATWMAACKQGEGQRCQVTEDCDDSLVCNQATKQCATSTGGGIDATVPDGPPPDASMVDAPVDAASMSDAPVLNATAA